MLNWQLKTEIGVEALLGRVLLMLYRQITEHRVANVCTLNEGFSSESEKEYRVLFWLITRAYNLKFVQTPANCRMCLYQSHIITALFVCYKRFDRTVVLLHWRYLMYSSSTVTQLVLTTILLVWTDLDIPRTSTHVVWGFFNFLRWFSITFIK